MRKGFSNNLDSIKYKTIPFRAKHGGTEGLGSPTLVNQNFPDIFQKPVCNPCVLGKKVFKICGGFPI